MQFNQGFTLGWNAFHTNLMMRVGEDRIMRNNFTSPFSQFTRNLEVGNYSQETYINPAKIYLHDTVINSDILTDHTDPILTTIHEVNVDLNIPSTYKEFLVRKSFNFWDNVNNLITSLVANLQVTAEIAKNNIVKQMLYNAWAFGMLDCVNVPNPELGDDESERYIIAINTLIDDFITETNKRNIIFNNQVGVTDEAIGISTNVPYVIMFNEYLRNIEQVHALNNVFGDYVRTTGNTNQDYSRRLIRLNLQDFPTSVPPIDRSDVTGDNVLYNPNQINFFESPTNSTGQPLFPNEPQSGDKPIAFVMDPEAIKIRTQLEINTNFTNPATLSTTNRLILRMIVSLSGFEKIACITTDDIAPVPPQQIKTSNKDKQK